LKFVTNYYNLNKKQEDIDFVNVNMMGDSKLFVNPILLEESTNEKFFSLGKRKVESFFKVVFDLYATGNKEQALQNMFDHSKESNANHFGFSEKESRGNGASKHSLSNLFDTVLDTGSLRRDIMAQPVSILVFAHDFGPDRMSDLTVSILKKEFVEYTLAEARKLNIPIEPSKVSYGEYWDYETASWKDLTERWIKGADGKKLILTPKQIVSHKYGFSVDDYIRKVVWVWRKDYHVKNKTSLAQPKYDEYGELFYDAPTVETLRTEEVRKPYAGREGKWKLYALDMTLKNPELYTQYFGNTTANKTNKNSPLTDKELTDIIKKG